MAIGALITWAAKIGFTRGCLHTRAVKDMIKRLENKMGKTIFICIHILSVMQQLYDWVGIISQCRLIALWTLDEIVAQNGMKTLEEAFIGMSGGVEEKELLSWRGQRGAGA